MHDNNPLHKMWFYGWGFYALGQDDTLERKLTGQPARPFPADDVNGSPRPKFPLAASPRQAEEGGTANSSSPDASTRAEAGNDGVVVVVDVDQGCVGEGGSTAGKVGAVSSLGEGDEGGWAGLKQRVSRVLLSPNIVAVAIGVVIAMIGPLQEMLFDNPRAILRPLGAAVEVRCSFPRLVCSKVLRANKRNWPRCTQRQVHAPRNMKPTRPAGRTRN